MAGLGRRLASCAYNEPKPLIKIFGKTIMEWAITSVGTEGNFIFCCRKDHIKNYEIDIRLKKIMPACEIISINYQTQGTVQTILEASHLINNDDELIISDSDHYILWDTPRFNKEIRNSNIDACVMIFPENQYSSALSYVKLDEEGYVVQAAEKIPISGTAAAGIHYYKKGSDFVKYGKIMIDKDRRFNNEFYVTPVYNELVEDGKKIVTFPIIKKWALGDPTELDIFLKEYKNYRNDN